ncbi:MAG: CotH kinase family protein [Defluviitaleaceae bacterium]|nr:CotH kinase family protein [Defluviitaleaceae bacterium]
MYIKKIAGFLITVIAVFVMAGVVYAAVPDFPSLHIESDGVPFVNRELWINSTFTLEGAEEAFEGAAGRIRGRGQSSWSRFPEKRPLRIRFDERRVMPGSEYAHRRWVLIAAQSDRSLMRDFFVSNLNMDNIGWSPHMIHVHLYVNGEYMGVYLLADERTVSDGRVEITGDSDPAISEYFLEIDWRFYRDSRSQQEGVNFFRINTHADGITGNSHSGSGNRDFLYEVRYPDEITPEHLEYARVFVDYVSRAIRSQNFERISAVLDIPSMIDFYIVQELMKNVDVGFSSTFMTIRGQGDERRLHMGPLWDFDVSAGNTSWQRNQTPYGLYVGGQFYWLRMLMRVPEFRDAVEKRWNTAAFEAIMQSIDYIQEYAENHQASFARNFERHEILGVMGRWPNPDHVAEIDTFLGQVEFLADFLTRRANYLNEHFGRE